MRTNVTFLREDLLWKSTEPVPDPYTGDEHHFPFGDRDSSQSVVLSGANILDMLERVRGGNSRYRPTAAQNVLAHPRSSVIIFQIKV